MDSGSNSRQRLSLRARTPRTARPHRLTTDAQQPIACSSGHQAPHRTRKSSRQTRRRGTHKRALRSAAGANRMWTAVGHSRERTEPENMARRPKHLGQPGYPQIIGVMFELLIGTGHGWSPSLMVIPGWYARRAETLVAAHRLLGVAVNESPLLVCPSPHWQLSLRIAPRSWRTSGRGLSVASFRDVPSLTPGPLRPGELLRAFAANLPPGVGARHWPGRWPATIWPASVAEAVPAVLRTAPFRAPGRHPYRVWAAVLGGRSRVRTWVGLADGFTDLWP